MLRRLVTLVGPALLAVGCSSVVGPTLTNEAISPDTSIASTTTTTSTTTIPPLTREDARAVISSAGIVVPVRAVNPFDWTIGTPCGNEGQLQTGQILGEVDVVIDPGHGGEDDPGAVGPTGLVEADVNLAVATRLESWLNERGFSTALTRLGDYRLPIVTRAEIAHALAPELLISVHHNGSEGLVDWGEPATEIYVQNASPDSQRLGELVFEELTAALSEFDATWLGSGNAGVRYRLDGDGSDFYGVLRRSMPITAVISEALFLSSPAEEALLRDPEVLDAEAASIGRAIERYLTTDDVGSGFVGGDTVRSGGSGSGGTSGCEDPALE